MAYTLPTLGYEYDALSRSISADIMQLHHSKHHQTYVDKLNTALEGKSVPDSLERLLSDLESVPEDVRTAVRNNGGGHYNHSLFWQFMSPSGGGEPTGDLGAAITEKYGSFQAFVDNFSAQAAGLFGSGWVWLQPDLSLAALPNQDSPIMSGGEAPILGLDVWEHAYYLDYRNVRADYIKAWWDVVDWQAVAERYQHAK
ncbi:superoxide dismutase [Candidatus Mycosynbacter amalyticus]|uniref:Superoxide dismutase n=1 Tax=Candidatus Mycosynbacter amalyticus TaxID=2665156 RepID=A0A857MP42_9BACT|nr:superoxide dismutase [Candidatus Mycosynbacter amalyticus]QHN42440.1 superoxide dismutase [Candidatus Mycosynbacter amalyticus]